MEQTKILVLGAAGFIGSALVERLVHNGLQVIALGHSQSVEHQGSLVRIRGTIEDSGLLETLLPACSHVVHVASRTTPGISAHEPELEVVSNLLPLSNLLNCIARFPGKRLIYVSSAGAIYGEMARDANELSPLRPRSYYGAGKVAAESFIHTCTMVSGTEAVILRPTNPYGQGQTVSKGFAIIPTLLQRALDSQPFHVWGDGAAVRDYCYINDLTAALVLVITRPSAEKFGIYNVASGCLASILDLIKQCQNITGRRIQVEFKPPRGVDVGCVSPRSDKIAEAYGWRPLTNLEDGLRMTWDWFSKNNAQLSPQNLS